MSYIIAWVDTGQVKGAIAVAGLWSAGVSSESDDVDCLWGLGEENGTNGEVVGWS